MKTEFGILMLLLPMILFTGCNHTEDEPEIDKYGPGIYIVNEGFFNGNNGSVGFYNPDDGTMVRNIFEESNARPVGDVLQSFAVNGDTAGFIVVNGSAKVEIVELSSFKTIAEPIAATYPRCFLPVTAEKGYLSNGSMQGYILIIDLHDLAVADSIAVGFGPESMVALDDKVYICNSGGWLSDSTLHVINVSTDEVVDTIKVGDVPVDIGLDHEQNLWVYCKGYAVYDWDPPYNLISETDACLYKIDPGTGDITWQGKVGKAGDYVTVLPRIAISSDGHTVYYLRPDGVYAISADTPILSAEPVFTGSYYGIEVDPRNGDIYLFEASLSGNGLMKIVDATMNLNATYKVGIMPNGAVFVY